MARQTKLIHAVDALVRISFLDQKPDATLADAVKLAEQALKEIEKDALRIKLVRTVRGGLTVHISSAAGNETIVRQVAPHVRAMLDALVVQMDGKPLKWGALKQTDWHRPDTESEDANHD